LSNFLPQINTKQANGKNKKGSSSNVVASSRSLDSTNDSSSQVTLEQEIVYWKEL
jgi:hypothetical protein